MGTQAKRYQGGAIVSFIMITAIVAALLVGGIFWLRHRGEMVRKDAELAAQQDEVKPPEGISSEEDKKASTQDDTFPAGSSTTQSQKNSDKDTDKQAGNDRSREAAASREGDNQTAEKLPETGPADMLFAMIAVGAITYASMQYVISRRALASTRISV